MTRRHFLGHCLTSLGCAALAPLLMRCSGEDHTSITPVPGAPFEVEPWSQSAVEPSPFLHGVASGDPHADSVILWTRVTAPRPEASELDAGIDVEWRIGSEPSLQQVIQQGVARALAEHDHTLHVAVSGLTPGSTYYYQFRALGQASPRGRTKTLPSGAVERLRLALTSCANYPSGFFNAYAQLARADIDLVVHLGDYLYEYANGTLGDGIPIERVPDPPKEIVSLEDYRRRHAQYKTDPDLQELHRQHPWIVVWDDHEVADNSSRTGAYNHQAGSEGDYATRKLGAMRAYREWMPLAAAADDAPIYRNFACGDLLDLVMLDTRLVGRDLQVDRCDVAELAAADRQLLGSAQEAWLVTALRESQTRGARWRFIGQQVIFSPMLQSMRGCVSSSDEWDGYQASRQRVLDALARDGIDNVVMLTGDAHSAWAMDVAVDPFEPALYDPESGRGSQLVEIVTPAVSSPPSGGPTSAILRTHPHIKFAEQTRNGYVLVDVTHERMQAEWYFTGGVRQRSLEFELGATYQSLAGRAHLVQAVAPSVPRSGLPAPA